MLTDGSAAAALAFASSAAVLADRSAAAALAFASSAAVLADGSAAAALAFASYAALLKDGAAAAALVLASCVAVLADLSASSSLACAFWSVGGASTALTSASSAVVLTDAGPPAFSAPALLAVVRAILVDPRHLEPSASLAFVSSFQNTRPAAIAPLANERNASTDELCVTAELYEFVLTSILNTGTVHS